MNWGASSDDVTASTSLQYKVVRAATTLELDTLAEAAAITGGVALVMDFTADARTALVSGLTSSTTYAFAVIVKDDAGNQTLYTPAAVTTLVNAAPGVTITSPSSTGTFITGASTIALSGTASDDLAVASVSWANTTNATSGVAMGTTAWSVPSLPLGSGANAIIVTATDGEGSTATATITVTRDDSGPTVTITSPSATGAFPTAAATVALNGTAVDPAGVALVAWSNAANGASGSATGTTTWSVAAVPLAAGVNSILVTATDGLGNTSSQSITVSRGCHVLPSGLPAWAGDIVPPSLVTATAYTSQAAGLASVIAATNGLTAETVLGSPIAVAGAMVLTTGFKPSSASGEVAFWVADQRDVIQVRLPLTNGQMVRAGDRVDFTVTRVNNYLGTPQVSEVTGLSVTSSNQPVYVRESSASTLGSADFFWVHHLLGEITDTGAACGGSSTCFTFRHGGPSGPTDTLRIQNANLPTPLVRGDCVELYAPASQLNGAVVMDVTDFTWLRWFGTSGN